MRSGAFLHGAIEDIQHNLFASVGLWCLRCFLRRLGQLPGDQCGDGIAVGINALFDHIEGEAPAHAVGVILGVDQGSDA